MNVHSAALNYAGKYTVAIEKYRGAEPTPSRVCSGVLVKWRNCYAALVAQHSLAEANLARPLTLCTGVSRKTLPNSVFEPVCEDDADKDVGVLLIDENEALDMEGEGFFFLPLTGLPLAQQQNTRRMVVGYPEKYQNRGGDPSSRHALFAVSVRVFGSYDGDGRVRSEAALDQLSGFEEPSDPQQLPGLNGMSGCGCWGYAQADGGDFNFQLLSIHVEQEPADTECGVVVLGSFPIKNHLELIDCHLDAGPDVEEDEVPSEH